jgi:hypothetical protein
VNHDLEIQRLASGIASWLVVPSWAGFIYTLLHRPHHVSLGADTASLPDVGLITVATLVCSLLTFVCALSPLSDDISSLSSWAFVIVCAVPFFGMLALLDPFGATPTYW